jgi:predicted regulator of Ras-like GTPase activity (Roadblock/LC7/MglB family)
MSSVQTSPEHASRAGRLDQILAELLRQTPGVEAAAVVSFDGLPMASALPAGMDEDRVAAMSAALLSLAERASQDLGRGDLSQVYIEGEHGSVFLVSAKDEAVLIAVTAAGAKVGMMLYEVKLAANKVGEALQGPAPLPTPLPSNLTRGYPDAVVDHPQASPQDVAGLDDDVQDSDEPDAEPADSDSDSDSAYADAGYSEPPYSEPPYSEPTYSEPTYSEPSYSEPTYSEPAYPEQGYESPLYDQVAHSQTERPDYFATVDYVGAAAPAATFDEDQPAADAEPEADHHPQESMPWYALSPEPISSETPAEPAAAATDNGWSSYAPSATVLPGEPTGWS